MEEAKAYMMKTDNTGLSLHGHLTALLQKILEDKPEDALTNLENLSVAVKASHFTPDSIKLQPIELPDEGAKQWMKTSNGLFKGRHQLTYPPEEEEEQHIPNVMEEMSWFEWAGVGLSRSEAYKVFLSMNNLMKTDKEKFKSVRFFGKILGTEKDYYVCEVAPNEPAEEEEGAEDAPPPNPEEMPAEAAGEGCNQFKYYACNDPSEGWTLLPDVKPVEIVVARQIKKMMTGHLSAPVRCYPPFPGTEKEYLRAQIAQIMAETFVVPKPLFDMEEAEEGEGPPFGTIKANWEDEEYEGPPAIADMMALDQWGKPIPQILKIGRCTNPPKPEGEGDDEEEAEAEEDPNREEPPQLLGTLDPESEPPVREGELNENMQPAEPGQFPVAAWTLRASVTDLNLYTLVMAQSNKWPGAYACVVSTAGRTPEGLAKNTTAGGKICKFSNVYIGYGIKNTGKAFTPAAPPPIREEAADPAELEDPSVEEENKILKDILDEQAEAEAEGGEDEDE